MEASANTANTKTESDLTLSEPTKEILRKIAKGHDYIQELLKSPGFHLEMTSNYSPKEFSNCPMIRDLVAKAILKADEWDIWYRCEEHRNEKNLKSDPLPKEVLTLREQKKTLSGRVGTAIRKMKEDIYENYAIARKETKKAKDSKKSTPASDEKAPTEEAKPDASEARIDQLAETCSEPAAKSKPAADLEGKSGGVTDDETVKLDASKEAASNDATSGESGNEEDDGDKKPAAEADKPKKKIIIKRKIIAKPRIESAPEPAKPSAEETCANLIHEALHYTAAYHGDKIPMVKLVFAGCTETSAPTYDYDKVAALLRDKRVTVLDADNEGFECMVIVEDPDNTEYDGMTYDALAKCYSMCNHVNSIVAFRGTTDHLHNPELVPLFKAKGIHAVFDAVVKGIAWYFITNANMQAEAPVTTIGFLMNDQDGNN